MPPLLTMTYKWMSHWITRDRCGLLGEATFLWSVQRTLSGAGFCSEGSPGAKDEGPHRIAPPPPRLERQRAWCAAWMLTPQMPTGQIRFDAAQWNFMTVGLLLIIIVMLYNVQSDNAPAPPSLPDPHTLSHLSQSEDWNNKPHSQYLD